MRALQVHQLDKLCPLGHLLVDLVLARAGGLLLRELGVKLRGFAVLALCDQGGAVKLILLLSLCGLRLKVESGVTALVCALLLQGDDLLCMVGN